MKIKLALTSVFFISFFATSFSQNVNGKWYGVGNVYSQGETNDYLSELLLQQSGNKVSGLYNYFFKDHHISSQIKGTYNPTTRLLVIHLLPLLNYSAKGLSNADCAMVGAFTLKVSKVGATLNGAFTPTNVHKFSCPDIIVKFTKSDAEGIMTKIVKKPLMLEGETEPEPYVVLKESLPSPVVIKKQEKKDPIVDLNTRRFTTREIDIYSDSISVSLFDNSEIDFDTVSLFYNKKLIAHKQLLSDKAINFRLAVAGFEEISMFAENLGKLPPNTALMVVYDGDVRHELPITSDYVVNGTVRFRRVKRNN